MLPFARFMMYLHIIAEFIRWDTEEVVCRLTIQKHKGCFFNRVRDWLHFLSRDRCSAYHMKKREEARIE